LPDWLCTLIPIETLQLKNCMTAILLSQINLLHNKHVICQK
jgi:hypothetical protein